ncbi:OsmC family protein [Rhizobium wuzhouense]|uniref:Osmotically inducible protein OsmC n=1 Tax=Rhizobium wuzhouense TaxID=1986026 RepID=A0ABX5NL31_9HYPH|nr:OsmC family protein [Rhizobium wuzhouense]PYB70448.1 osmotically inducible protein OsmC [Rhizobium wuzhouense]
MADLHQRPIGATATLGRTGYPHVRSETGGTIDIVTGVSEPGFNPLDLLLASLAACMSMSARIAAREMGLNDRLSGVSAKVSGEKAKEGPSRFQTLTVVFRFEGGLNAAEQLKVAHRAEEVCTVSNTLAIKPDIVLDPA